VPNEKEGPKIFKNIFYNFPSEGEHNFSRREYHLRVWQGVERDK
jgi:hypothetical protein